MFSILGKTNSSYDWTRLLPPKKSISIAMSRPYENDNKDQHIILHNSPYMLNYRTFDHHWTEFLNLLHPFTISRIVYNLHAPGIDLDVEFDQIADFISNKMSMNIPQMKLQWFQNNNVVTGNYDHKVSIYIAKKDTPFTENMVVITTCGQIFTFGDYTPCYSFEDRYAVAFHEMCNI